MSRRMITLSLLLFLACQPDVLQKPQTNRAPSAAILPPPPVVEGSYVALDGRESVDPDGDSLTYSWAFGDGGQGDGVRDVHWYLDDGSYLVTLVVQDPEGAADTAMAQVTVTNAPPKIITLATPTEQNIDSAALITVFVLDPGSADTVGLIIDWGDQARDTLPDTSQVTHKYEEAGSYYVKVTARDNDGGENSRTTSAPIVVFDPRTNQPPVAAITVPSSITEGALVTFSAAESRDPEGNSLAFTWSFGDGRNVPSQQAIESFWRYPDNGTFTVSLIVSDRRGGADTASAVITVLNAAPVILAVDPPYHQAPGLRDSAVIAILDPGLVDTHIATIDWGDGTRDSVNVEASKDQEWARYAPQNHVAHIYASPGSYLVRAVVRDSDGAIDSATADHVVQVIDPSRRRTIAGYEVLDLGTLGGNSAHPLDFNDYGKVVGSSLTASGQTHAFLWEDGAMRDLGTLGQEGSIAERINNAGVIAGVVWPAERNDDCTRYTIATIWRNGMGTLLESQSAVGRPVHATAINELGDVAWRACSHEHTVAWVSRGDAWERLSGIISSNSWSNAVAMNERRQIVGGSPAVQTGESPEPRWHATKWEDGATHDLGGLAFIPCDYYPDKNCSSSAATDINESGQIVGFSSAADQAQHAVLWTNGVVRDLWKAPPSYGLNDRVVINDVGQVAGSWGGEGFFWSNGSLQTLGSLGGGSTKVVDVNDAGMVVGTSLTASGEQHVFLWTQQGGIVDLGTGPHGFKRGWVVGISYFGDVVGFTAPQCDAMSGNTPCHPPASVRSVLWQRLSR